MLLFSKAFSGDGRVLRFPELAEKPARVINMARLGEALTELSPPIRLLFVYNSNPASIAPDSAAVRRGLARDDLFTVVHEQVMTPTARYADLLLPATTFLENRDLYQAYGHFHLGLADPAMAPMGEARSNFDLFQDLARKMGFADPPFMQTADERLAAYLRTLRGLPDGAAGDLRPGRYVLSDRGASAAAGGMRTAFAFRTAEDRAASPLPHLPEDPEAAEDAVRHPFRLITPPHPDLLNSTFGDRYPERIGEVLIHPEDAARCRIGDGDRVAIFNERGRTERRARISADTRPGLLVAEGLFWPGGDGTAVNDLTWQRTTDIGDGPTFHDCRVGMLPA